MNEWAAGKSGFKLQPSGVVPRAGRPLVVTPKLYGRTNEMDLLNHLIQWCGCVAILMAMAWAMMMLAKSICT